MSRKCAVTGKGVMSGNNVSHANNRTRRRFLPNLQETSFQSDTLNRAVRLRVCVKAMRSIDRAGGIDAFLMAACRTDLSRDALSLRRQIQRSQSNANANATPSA